MSNTTGIERPVDVLGSVTKGGRHACSSSEEGYHTQYLWLNTGADSPSAAQAARISAIPRRERGDVQAELVGIWEQLTQQEALTPILKGIFIA